MTERGRGAIETTPDYFRIGPSSLERTKEALTIRFDEWTVPLPSRLRGSVRLELPQNPGETFFLDANKRHRWTPIAPVTRCTVDLKHPSLRWSGGAYFDWNMGSEPLEAGFSSWQWSRAHVGGDAVIFYEAERRDTGNLSLGLRIDRDNQCTPIDLPPRATLPTTLWGISRGTRSDASSTAGVEATLESAPFYARSLVNMKIQGVPATAFHESLSLDRFAKNWVRLMLPFRMPRRTF